MVRQNELAPAPGSKRRKIIVGRGDGSGHGNYCGRGAGGQKKRSGDPKMKPGFEGGQNPLIKRLPGKRGFTNKFREEFVTVNVSLMNRFEAGSTINAEQLKKLNLIKTTKKPLKILGDGDIDRSVTVQAHRFSASARQKIEAAGGKIEVI